MDRMKNMMKDRKITKKAKRKRAHEFLFDDLSDYYTPVNIKKRMKRSKGF